jgi:hypothetical protein
MVYDQVAAVGTSSSKHMNMCGKEMAIRADVVLDLEVITTANVSLILSLYTDGV